MHSGNPVAASVAVCTRLRLTKASSSLRGGGVAVLLVLVACHSGTEPRNTIAAVEVIPAQLELQMGAQLTGQLMATARTSRGAIVTTATFTWNAADASVASVSPTGVVTAVAPGSTTVDATAEGVRGSATVLVLPAAVASVAVSLGAATIGVGEHTQATVTAFDAGGGVVTGRAAQWSSSSPAVATVSASGAVTATGTGSTDISAQIDGFSGSARLTVVGTRPNLALANVTLTQSVQRYSGGVPLVANGNPVLVNVFGSLDRPFPAGSPTARVHVALFNGANRIFDDERALTGVVKNVADSTAPIHQLVVAPDLAQPGLRVLVSINADSTLPEETLSDNVWPRSGQPQSIDVRAVPSLPLHFVPIYLTLGGSTGTVTQSSMSEYLYALRQMHPVAGIDVDIGGVFSSDVAFGSGASDVWLTMLGQLDVLRVVEGTSRYYIGAVRPPPGVTFTQFGGFSYIPSDPLSYGPSTRTSVLVGVGWFNRQRQTTELVAHELAHALGRRHAPCGGAASPDPAYPYPAASIGVTGYDVYSWSLNPGGFPIVMPASSSDIMSYCTPAWISDYNYEALLRWRLGSPMIAAAATPCECLVVWGTARGDSVTLNPAFVTDAYTALPERRGSYRLEGLDARGAPLLGFDFEPAEVDHAPGVRQFTFAVPVDDHTRAALDRIRVVHNGHGAALRALARGAGGPVAPNLTTIDANTAELRWDPAVTGAVLVRDPVTGRVLGIGGSGGRLRVRTTRRELEVIASQGLTSSRLRLRAEMR